jgi:hypothetical protein
MSAHSFISFGDDDAHVHVDFWMLCSVCVRIYFSYVLLLMESVMWCPMPSLAAARDNFSTKWVAHSVSVSKPWIWRQCSVYVAFLHLKILKLRQCLAAHVLVLLIKECPGSRIAFWVVAFVIVFILIHCVYVGYAHPCFHIIFTSLTITLVCDDFKMTFGWIC